jgi:ATP-GRASP peptide maturase of grasp-with-spasm system
MILLLSTSGLEASTSDVMNWITYLGGSCIRMNGEDLDPGAAYTLELGDGPPVLTIDLDGTPTPLDDVHVVFFRGRYKSTPPSLASVADPALAESIGKHLRAELAEVRASVQAVFQECEWLPDPSSIGLNKIAALRVAREVGLETPATLLTTSKAAALRFVQRHGKVAMKSLAGASLQTRDGGYHLYTELVDVDDLATVPDRHFPCLLQAYVEKQYEIRTFYLAGRCYSMGVFSQLDAKTTVDFRRYNWKTFNRCVPVRLPAELELGIRTLMERVGLSTGSLDLIKCTDGRYVFLEVNPVGQFGFVSSFCNYPLEKALAEFLITKDGTRGES